MRSFARFTRALQVSLFGRAPGGEERVGARHELLRARRGLLEHGEAPLRADDLVEPARHLEGDRERRLVVLPLRGARPEARDRRTSRNVAQSKSGCESWSESEYASWSVAGVASTRSAELAA